MADIIVSDNENGTEEIAEHNAAVAEGAATVRAEQASEAASRAEQAVDAVSAIGAGVADTASVSMAAAEQSAQSAAIATEGRDAVLAAIQAQTDAISSLVEELRESRNTAPAPAPAPEKTRRTTDREPATNRQHPYFKKIGRSRKDQ